MDAKTGVTAVAEGNAPVIGITCGHDTAGGQDRWFVKAPYIRAVVEAGGVPLLIPPTWDERLLVLCLDRVDGLLLTGGVDVDPALYGQEPHKALGKVDREWDDLDVVAARLALARDMPVLGICRGVQVLNVAAGGTLVQDIASQVKGALAHQQSAPVWEPTHEVTVAEGSRLHALLGVTATAVNSFHHQAVQVVAPGFRAVAHAADGVIEGIESELHRFAVGVQWHPELMAGSDAVQRRLFAGFLAAVRTAAGSPANGR